MENSFQLASPTSQQRDTQPTTSNVATPSTVHTALTTPTLQRQQPSHSHHFTTASPCQPHVHFFALPSYAILISKTKTSIAYFIPWTDATKAVPGFKLVEQHRPSHYSVHRDLLGPYLLARISRACMRKSMLLAERRHALRNRMERIKYRVLLKKQKDRMKLLKMRAKLDYAMSAAQLKRQLYLKAATEKYGALVEHAQTVAMVHKMRKYLNLKKELLESSDLDMLSHTLLEGDSDYELDEVDVTHTRRISAATSYSSELSDGTCVQELASRMLASLQDQDIQEEEEDFEHHRHGIYIPAESQLETLDESEYVAELSEFLPPITRFTLRELDLEEILNNPQLRHDLYFDPHLQFKPNTEGEKGHLKRARTAVYWQTVQEEVHVKGETHRITILLFEIKCILKELLPFTPELTLQVNEMMDMALIAQQIQHNVFQPVEFITCLCQLLRENCAPARDEWVDSMLELAQQGHFVKCLKVCFEVLEWMKLDYANHQLTKLRPFIVEHAPQYEWNQFILKYDAELPSCTFEWLSTNHTQLLHQTSPFSTSLAHILPKPRQEDKIPFHTLYWTSLVTLISKATDWMNHEESSDAEGGFPETFYMDTSRLVGYYNDWQDITIMGTLLVLFKQVCGASLTSAHNERVNEFKSSLWILLNDAETSLSHIILHMSESAGKIRGQALPKEQVDVMSRMVEKTLCASQGTSQVYHVMQNRVGALVLYLLLSKDSKENVVQLATKYGLADVMDQVLELAERITVLGTLNLQVYQPLYSSIMERVYIK